MNIAYKKNWWIPLALIVSYAIFAGISFQYFHDSILRSIHESSSAHLIVYIVDGSYITLSISLVVLLVVWFVRLVRSYELALQQGEERYRNIIESTPDMIWESNERFEYQLVSPMSCRLLGCTPKEAQGKTPFDFMSLQAQVLLRAFYTKCAEGQSPISSIEVEYRQGDTGVVYAEVNAIPILDELGNVSGYRGVDRDITERKQVEKIIERTNDFYHVLFDIFPLPIWRTGTDGRISYLNTAATELLAMTLGELGSFVEVIHPADRTSYLMEYQFAIDSRIKFTLTYRLLVNHCEYVDIIQIGVPCWASDNSFIGFIGCLLDRHNLELRGTTEELIFSSSGLNEHDHRRAG